MRRNLIRTICFPTPSLNDNPELISTSGTFHQTLQILYAELNAKALGDCPGFCFATTSSSFVAFAGTAA
jgi:hypothetical protein